MKNKAMFGVMILGLLALGDASYKTFGDSSGPVNHHGHEVVVAWAFQSGESVATGNGSQYQYDGAKVYASSSSSGAPKYPQDGPNNRLPLVEIAEAAAELSARGYDLKWSDNGLVLMAVKTPAQR